MVLVRIGQFLIISISLRIIWELFSVSSRNLFANKVLKSLADFWLNSQFFLNILYIKSADNPTDFYTRYF